MGLEIEKKFLIKNDNWKQFVSEEKEITQGYLNANPNRTVRVRIAGKRGFLTIKSKSKGSVRSEFEYEIPIEDATELIELCEKPILSKTRFIVKFENHKWEIDVFEKENKGLVVAEIELSKEDEFFLTPDWIGKEVTEETKYYNSQLIENPYSEWD
ncbi:MAG: CYTH domain-containing protein [Flavobacteriales bacterium]|jgi:adenylate cyclase